jgi:FkbM family methyltransferase
VSVSQPAENALENMHLKQSHKKRLARLLDRLGGRFALGKMATRYARRITGDDVEIRYCDGLWIHRAGPHFFPDGMRFDYVSGEFSRWKMQADQYFACTNEFWLQHYRPKKGDVIIDVGAGHGEDTLVFSRAAGETGRVIAVEAHPPSFAILESFCQLNGLRNVVPLHLALMDRPGNVRVVESESGWAMNTVENNGALGIKATASTVDEICREYDVTHVNFLKMNIEGSERYALLGMTSIMPKIDQICVACHDFLFEQGHGEQFRTRAFVEGVLKKHGFTLASRPDDPRDYVRDHVFGLRKS